MYLLKCVVKLFVLKTNFFKRFVGAKLCDRLIKVCDSYTLGSIKHACACAVHFPFLLIYRMIVLFERIEGKIVYTFDWLVLLQNKK